MIGVDEAGRGPLAGPVAVGVVMVLEGFDVAKEFQGVKDSKKLSEKKREKIFQMLVARIAKGYARRPNIHKKLSSTAMNSFPLFLLLLLQQKSCGIGSC